MPPPDEALHARARECAGNISSIDRKQLRFNEIVECAQEFYEDAPDGVRELVEACDKASPLWTKGRPMWAVLRDEYQWMRIADAST